MKYRGKVINIDIRGGSHSRRIDFSLSGIKEGEKISLDELNKFLQRRSTRGKSYASDRKEEDKAIFLEGLVGLERGADSNPEEENSVSEGEKLNQSLMTSISDGKIIKGYFINKDVKSKDYKQFNKIPRPGHIDYIAKKKYGQDFDISGSSNFSGRMTVALVACGGIAKQILKSRGIEIGSHIESIFNIKDKRFDPVNLTGQDLSSLEGDLSFLDESMIEKTNILIEKFKDEKDSFGGIIELGLVGDLNFIGGPYFDRLQARISNLILSIPGTKAIEFGNGFEASKLKGSENNDSLIFESGRVKTLTNTAGGLVGGVANGMPIIIRVGAKPTASIAKKQESLNLESLSRERLEINGRHDPAFVLRICPVLESMLAIAILDEVYDQEAETLRDRIDLIDRKLADLYIERMSITDRVGYEKYKKKLPVDVPEREEEIVKKLIDLYPDYGTEISALYASIFKNSKNRQENIIKKNTALYGLIGRKLSYSYSKEIHESLSDYNYELIELKPEEVGEFLNRKGLRGLNVTIPYKKTVIPFLDELTWEAKKLGVVNTISFKDGRKIGHNTDYYGFKKLLITKRIYVKDKNILVLGTGATSRTIKAVVKSLGAKKVSFVSRRGDLNYSNLYDLKDYEVLVNATPVGTDSISDELLVDLDRLPSIKAVVDVVYNPMYSRLILEAKKRGLRVAGGLDMLVYQAKKAVEIFTDTRILDKEARKIRDKIFLSKCNIVLVGMPGSGKTTIGRQVAKALGKIHVDLDEEFFKEFKLRPDRIIADKGEEVFRDMESQLAAKIGRMNNLVISTGGGVVTREDNYNLLKQNGLIILIERDVRKLSTRGRILSQGGLATLFAMKARRQANYRMFADYTVVNDGYFKYAVEEIIDLIGKKVSFL